jgi:hypothetical protein
VLLDSLIERDIRLGSDFIAYSDSKILRFLSFSCPYFIERATRSRALYSLVTLRVLVGHMAQ